MSTRALTGEQRREIIELRSQQNPPTCGEVAKRIGCPEYVVWNVMKVHRYGGKAQNRARRREKKRTGSRLSPENAVMLHESIYIEAGMNGGFIATIADKWTGPEKHTLKEAVKSVTIGGNDGE